MPLSWGDGGCRVRPRKNYPVNCNLRVSGRGLVVGKWNHDCYAVIYVLVHHTTKCCAIILHIRIFYNMLVDGIILSCETVLKGVADTSQFYWGGGE